MVIALTRFYWVKTSPYEARLFVFMDAGDLERGRR